MSQDYSVILELGDWSNDGHGRTEKIIMTSNYPVENVCDAYLKAVKQSGVAVHAHSNTRKSFNCLCEEYERNQFSWDEASGLEKIGITKKKLHGIITQFENKLFSPSTEEFANLFMEMAKTQLPLLKWSHVEDKTETVQDYITGFFGYGLF